MRTRLVAALALLAAIPAIGNAQARSFTPTFGFGVGVMSIDGTTAANSQVGDQAWGIHLDGGIILKRFIVAGVDLGGQFLDDKAQFTQNTTGGEKESTANVTYFSGLLGLRSATLPGVPVRVGVNGGFSGTMTRRSIDNCVDCRVDKLKIPGGAFVEPNLVVGGGALRLRVSDRIYTGDGMKSMILVGGEYSPKKK